MLHIPADFPHAGSFAFLAPRGDRVRILRDNADDTALISFEPEHARDRNRNASGNRVVDFAHLAETREDAAASVSAREDLTDARLAQLDLLALHDAHDRASAMSAMLEGASPGTLAALVSLGLAQQAQLPLGGDSKRRTSHYWLTASGRAIADQREAVAA